MFLIFLNTAAICLMILAGYAVRRWRLVDAAFNRQLSLVLMNVFYPALIFSAVTRRYTIASLAAHWALPAGAIIIMTLGWGVGQLLRPLLRRQPEATLRSFLFSCTMNNYSFLPIMLVAGLMGDAAIAQVVLASFGAEICFWTLGVQALTGHAVSLRSLRHLRTMPMGALAAAVALLGLRAAGETHGLNVAHLPSAVQAAGATFLQTLHMVGQATIPVSAIICGSRMAELETDHVFTRPIVAFTALRLAIIPALTLPLLRLLPLEHASHVVLTIIAVQPAAMSSVYMAEIYHSDAHFAAAGVMTTHILCLATIPLWLHFIM